MTGKKVKKKSSHVSPRKDLLLAMKSQLVQAESNKSKIFGQRLALLPRAIVDSSGLPRKDVKENMRKALTQGMYTVHGSPHVLRLEILQLNNMYFSSIL